MRQSLLDHLQVLVRVDRRLIEWNARLNVLAHNWNIGHHTALGCKLEQGIEPVVSKGIHSMGYLGMQDGMK